jgi:DNA-binding response OmpR family regulator
MPYKVLLVDDDLDLLPSMVALLEELSDFEILTAENGLEGLEKAVNFHPDCMLIDVRMPELNGYHLVQTLRGDPDTADIPLIILSAMVQERDQWTGLAVGVDRYLTKPVDADELIATIIEVTKRSNEDRLAQLQALADQEPPERS